MRLTSKELNRLTIFTLAELARRRRSRGRRLNAPEAIAVLCDEILEMAWDGVGLAEIIERAAQVLSRDDVMDGVPDIIGPIEIDALFPSGSKLVVVDEPFGPAAGDQFVPGEVLAAAGPVRLNEGKRSIRLSVTNHAAVPIEVTSHFHFFEANRRLSFDRRLAIGMRLDVPAGISVRWEPGEQRHVDLIPLAGARTVWGFGGLTEGPLDEADAVELLNRAIEAGYLHEESPDAG